MTENELRNLYVNTAISHLGAVEGTAAHREIVNLYNRLDPLPRGHALTMTDDWCAGFVSAMAVESELTDIICCECSCGQMVRLFNAIGGWMETDSYVPQKGDIIMYDWDDSGIGENTGAPEHVGIVVSVTDSTIKIIEGNSANKVQYTTIALNGRYIRGFCLPDYASKATATEHTFYSGNRWLTLDEMKVNARYIYNYLAPRGWTLNAIAGMLGNMQTESTLNPAIWQSLNEGNTSGGYGLVQWTPASNFLEWCSANGYDPEHMDSALKRIEYELANGLQYYPTDTYPLTFAEFKTSTADPSHLAFTFLNNYERPADRDQPARGEQAEYWYNYLRGYTPPDTGGDDIVTPPATPIKRHRMALILMAQAIRNR